MVYVFSNLELMMTLTRDITHKYNWWCHVIQCGPHSHCYTNNEFWLSSVGHRWSSELYMNGIATKIKKKKMIFGQIVCFSCEKHKPKIKMKGVVNQFHLPSTYSTFHLYTNIRGLFSPPTKRALHTNCCYRYIVPHIAYKKAHNNVCVSRIRQVLEKN